MQAFQQLTVWQKAHDLVLHVYKASATLPSSENLGLSANLRRSAIAIPRLIAEGAGRDLVQDFALDLRKARAAGHELEYLFLLCRDLGFFPEPLHTQLKDELVEVRKMISGLLPRITASAATER